MRNLQKLGRKLSKLEQQTINGGIDRECGWKCPSNNPPKCCKPCKSRGLFCGSGYAVPTVEV